MAVVRSHEALSSTPYDVFLNFRGEDTRYTFTDHLCAALVREGISTFRDEDDIEKGKKINSELKKGICQSKISVIVISKTYASSESCLDELVMILEQTRISGHEVLPVFYGVDPSQVREQTGTIEEAFAMYEKQFQAEMDSEAKIKLMEKTKKWRSALTKVADIRGLDLRNQTDRHESKIIQDIVQWVKEKLRHTRKKRGYGECFECDLEGHWASDCPWKRRKCPKGCEGVMKLFISNKERSKGLKFLRCIICKKFVWLSKAARKLEK